jgi:cyclic pyranopterin phosphate synthase
MNEQERGSAFTHLDERGRAKMVDVGEKEPTHRVAEASGSVLMKEETLRSIINGDLIKGDVLSVAQIAGIQGAKRTPELIPLCHPLRLSHVEVMLEPDVGLPGIRIRARVEAVERTGVEMEALTAVCVAALTVYDMCKAVDREIRLTDVHLDFKSGGKSGTFRREDTQK